MLHDTHVTRMMSQTQQRAHGWHHPRLESKLDELKSSGTEDGDRHLLEHLFFSGQPADLQRLAEEGFPQPPLQALSNSLSLALEQGIAAQTFGRGFAGWGGDGGSGGVVHHVLVAKVLTSHCQKARPHVSCAHPQIWYECSCVHNLCLKSVCNECKARMQDHGSGNCE